MREEALSTTERDALHRNVLACLALVRDTATGLHGPDLTVVLPGAVDGAAVLAAQRERLDLLRSLQELGAAASALAARVAVDLEDAERARVVAEGMPAARAGRGIAAQVALARRSSPHRGAVLLGAARVWTTEMPCTFAALAAGAVEEWTAVQLVRETACLAREDRERVDREVCGDLAALEGVGVVRLLARARKAVYAADPAAVVERARRAADERTVTLRPAPDTMSYLTALLPVAQGVSALAALRKAAAAGRATGDGRSVGQLMADTLVQRVTGQASADAVPVCVNLVVSDATLLASGPDAAVLAETGAVVPAQVARELVAASLAADDPALVTDDDAVPTWLRRLYAAPDGSLMAMTSRARFHPPGLAAFLRVRDQGICRTPWCDAPIRHLDHVVAVASGGPTSATYGQGLCQACNHARQAPGWDAEVDGVGPHRVTVITPSGFSASSTAPTPPAPLRREGGSTSSDGGPRAEERTQALDERSRAGVVDWDWSVVERELASLVR